MKLPLTEQFVLERAEFRLRHVCEDCSYFDETRDECAHGYPTREHRRGYDTSSGEIVFCKEFELRG